MQNFKWKQKIKTIDQSSLSGSRLEANIALMNIKKTKQPARKKE